MRLGSWTVALLVLVVAVVLSLEAPTSAVATPSPTVPSSSPTTASPTFPNNGQGPQAIVSIASIVSGLAVIVMVFAG